MAYEFDSLINITSILRGENGCPWDRKQSPESMKKYIIEEAYETVQAIDDINRRAMRGIRRSAVPSYFSGTDG